MHFYPRTTETDIGRPIFNVYLDGKVESPFSYDAVTLDVNTPLKMGISECTVEGYDNSCFALIWYDTTIPFQETDKFITGLKGLIVDSHDSADVLRNAIAKFIEKPIII